ncbi:hypothetical protein B0J11DRAFT_594700 [Dendryphion nanum]|uniref:DNA-directed DNA polymerase n=1 Tax=Dendryphion nanum TaxID=256645 RepID=A0A9P9IC04_9PLEO|nr:hypothetical protein B0J11DRAFT_594700 [Dendryphion nanum]
MADNALARKLAYFREQELIDISDDETGFPDTGLIQVECALADTEPMPPPRKLQFEFDAHTSRRRATARMHTKNLNYSYTAPESERQTAALKHSTSLPDLASGVRVEMVPFYKRVGVVPRELKTGKNVKLANNINLEPEHKQLFKEKIIYFYPNDDISSARRQRIHKIIQLGAAWVKKWRDDVTHIMVDDESNTYLQLLKHLNVAGLPRKVVMVKFDPYVPQCIQFNTVLEPTANRFIVKGAPRPSASALVTHAATDVAKDVVPPPLSQRSFNIKQSKRQIDEPNTQSTDSIPDFLPQPFSKPCQALDDFVEDSFILLPDDPVDDHSAPDSYNDALSQAICEAKAVAHLPLDDEDSDYTTNPRRDNYDSDPDTDNESSVPKEETSGHMRSGAVVNVTRGKGSKAFNRSNFQCMDPVKTNTNSSQNPNVRTIQVLEEMGRYYDQLQDSWRTLAYRRAVTTLRKQTNTKITTKEQAAALPFIGSRLAAKIEEIVLTDRLRRLESTKDDPTDRALRLFLGVYGAGLSQAHKWLQAGHRTLSDLTAHAHLTPSQRVGIERYTDFATRIPRDEVAAHGDFVRTEIHKIDPGFDVHIMGSYRRGAKDSGDIDLLITKPITSLTTLRTVVFEHLVPRLYELEFLKASLATSSRTKDGTKWLGASCLPGSKIWRRLDLLIVPEPELGAALIYFTGNDIFNRSIRLLASKMGMRLNQKGLYKDVVRGSAREKISEGTLVEGRSERRIFEVLGVPWREPSERIYTMKGTLWASIENITIRIRSNVAMISVVKYSQYMWDDYNKTSVPTMDCAARESIPGSAEILGETENFRRRDSPPYKS